MVCSNKYKGKATRWGNVLGISTTVKGCLPRGRGHKAQQVGTWWWWVGYKAGMGKGGGVNGAG